MEKGFALGRGNRSSINLELALLIALLVLTAVLGLSWMGSGIQNVYNIASHFGIAGGVSGPVAGAPVENPPGSGSYTLTWTGGTPPFAITRSTLPDMSGATPVASGLPGMNYSVVPQPGENDYQVIDGNGHQLPSIITITLPAGSTPSAGSGSDNGDGSYQLSWTGGRPPFQIIRDTDPAMTSPAIEASVPSRNYTVQPTDPDNYYQVIDSGGNRLPQPIHIVGTSVHLLTAADLSSGAQMSCQNCHGAAPSDFVDPHDPTSPWAGDITGDQKSYCFSCHNGQRLPTAGETLPAAPAVRGKSGATTAPDIEAANLVNVHGLGTASDPGTTTAYLRPDMGYYVGDSMDCSTCHDSHDTSNTYGLRSSVVSADGAKKVGGLLVYKIPAGTITPTSPVGYDLRFFCSSCHLFDPATHDPLAGTDTTQVGKTDCTSCHRHVDMHGTPSTGL